ncbi:hypothetical protein [Pseudomonas vancouverensis]|nr:hypothetical protein [Pseudomonas vancouverensis]KAB0495783.1 hypothetical protein F7R09_14660 [Pseudomonas vancouverensis]
MFVVIIMLIAPFKIAKKAGYGLGTTVLFYIPILNIFVYWIFAFSEWPIEKEIAQLEGENKPQQ